MIERRAIAFYPIHEDSPNTYHFSRSVHWLQAFGKPCSAARSVF